MADQNFLDHLCQSLETFLPDAKVLSLRDRLGEDTLNLVSNEKYSNWLRRRTQSTQHPNIQDNRQYDKREEIASSFEFLIHCVEPTLLEDRGHFEGGWDKKDMMKYCDHALAVMRICQVLLSALFGSRTQDIIDIEDSTNLLRLRKFLMKKLSHLLVLLCAVHVDHHQWTTEASNAIAKELLNLICSHCQCSCVEELLSGCVEVGSKRTPVQGSQETCNISRVFPSGLLKHVLDYLRPFLHKDTWKKSPLFRHGLVWCTMKVKHPYLGEHFAKLMPPLLLFIDDYEVENKVLGLTCLKHVIDNVNSAELLWYGRADVLYEAIQRLLFTNDSSLVLALHPCVLSILAVIEPSPKKPKFGRKTTKCDSVFQIILSTMEFESKIVMRRAYARHLKDFVEHMGITVLRHFKRLLRIIVSYLEVSDYPEESARLDILDTLRAVMLYTWPRIPNHSSTILKSLLRLIVDVADSSPHMNDRAYRQLKAKTIENLLILLRCCGKQVEDQLKELKKRAGHKEVEECMTKVLQEAGVEQCVTGLRGFDVT